MNERLRQRAGFGGHVIAWSLLALIILSGGGGCVQDMHSPEPPNVIASPPPAEIRLTRRIIGYSVLQTPIELITFGDGPVNVLIVGAIHGDEPTSAALTQKLVSQLESDPSLHTGRRVGIIPISNPDGYAIKSRYNANRVDVNRNFPAKNFSLSRTAVVRPGKSPASEPETRAILDALTLMRPQLIISIHSISRGRECNNFDGPAEGIARMMSTLNHYPVKPNIGYPTPGSMGSYCGGDLRIPMITLELPKDRDGDSAWEENRGAILLAIRAAG